jgi:hypothetical protein
MTAPAAAPAGKSYGAGMGGWLRETGRRTAAFLLSLLCGVVVPLSTLEAEAWVTGDIDGVSWFSVGVTYVAGIGLVSSSKSGLIVMLLVASLLAFVYGVNMKGAFDWKLAHPGAGVAPFGNVWIAQSMIGVASLTYMFERVGKHLFDNKSFPE